MSLNIYTQNGKLLVVNSSLASSADCCCDDDPIVKCCILGQCVEVRASECAFHGGTTVDDCEDCEPPDPLAGSTCTDCCPNGTELLVRVTGFVSDLRTGGGTSNIQRFGRLGQSVTVSAELLMTLAIQGGSCIISDQFCATLGTFGGQFTVLLVQIGFALVDGKCTLRPFLTESGVSMQVSICRFPGGFILTNPCGELERGGNAFSDPGGSPVIESNFSFSPSQCVGVFQEKVTRAVTWPAETNTLRGPYLGGGVLRNPGEECDDPLPSISSFGDLNESGFTFERTTLVSVQPAPP
jgi:hypothetical protein